MATTLQIRDLDEETIVTLKARAAEARMSLSAYVAAELAAVARRPTNAQVMARAKELAQAGGGAEDDDILTVIRQGRDR